MKIYESAYTYIPFAYLFIISTVFAALFHSPGILNTYRPFTVLTFILINTTIQFYFTPQILVKNIIHKHVWKTVTLGVYGILFNSIHEMIFEKFHFASTHVNYTVSFFYILVVFVCGYYYNENRWIIYTHIIALYFPIARVWQINMYVYVLYIAASIFIMFSKCSNESLMNDNLYRNPVVRYFLYLRINDSFIFLGIFQLYIEYYSMHIPEMKALDELEKIFIEQRKKYSEKRFDTDGSI